VVRVEGCQQSWPEPEVAAGGTVAVPVLGDWVDPEGDPIVLLSAALESGTAQVASTPEGRVVFQHADTGEGGDATAPVTLTVADTRGAVTTKTLSVRVLGDPQPHLQSFAVVDTADRASRSTSRRTSPARPASSPSPRRGSSTMLPRRRPSSAARRSSTSPRRTPAPIASP
jgi:hypothetical protein